MILLVSIKWLGRSREIIVLQRRHVGHKFKASFVVQRLPKETRLLLLLPLLAYSKFSRRLEMSQSNSGFV